MAVKGGGHNVAGRGTIDAGLMIDLSLMKGIHVDAGIATARVQGGATWKEYNRETQLHGLASTGGVISSTGVAGLTLGGGLGWLMAKYGMAVDNLRSVEIVTAEGRVVTASTDENADLFWAIRGGGGNFGVASSFEFNVHPVGPIVTGGLVAHPFATARDVLRFFRDTRRRWQTSDARRRPDSRPGRRDEAGRHCGVPLRTARRRRSGAPSRSRAFGSPVMDVIGPMPYRRSTRCSTAAFPKGALQLLEVQFLPTLSDAAIDTLRRLLLARARRR